MCQLFSNFVDPMWPSQVQQLRGQGWWVPWNFDLYPKSPQCFPLNRNVSILVHPCRPFEPNHSALSISPFGRFVLHALFGFATCWVEFVLNKAVRQKLDFQDWCQPIPVKRDAPNVHRVVSWFWSAIHSIVIYTVQPSISIFLFFLPFSFCV